MSFGRNETCFLLRIKIGKLQRGSAVHHAHEIIGALAGFVQRLAGINHEEIGEEKNEANGEREVGFGLQGMCITFSIHRSRELFIRDK